MDSQIYQRSLSKKQLELLRAVESGSLPAVQKLFNGSLNQDELFAYVLLATALQREDKCISMFLIENHATVKIPQKTGFLCTPSYYAVKMKDFEIFQALWKRGASLYDRDANKESALELAMLQNNSPIINYVLDEVRLCKIEELRPYRERDKALFHAACWFGNTKAVEMFMSRHFSITSQSSFVRDEWKGFTAVHFALASKSSCLDSLNILLQYDDVDFYAQDERGRTCLHFACRKQAISIFNLIFSNDTMVERIRRSSKNRPINPVDENGLGHFHIFCSMKTRNLDIAKQMDFIKHFIESGVDVNSSVSIEDENFPGYTALKFAIMNSSWEVSKFLLKNGADPTKMETPGKCPLLHRVCFKREFKSMDRLEIIKLLLQNGANPIAKNSDDDTPLHSAFSRHADFRPLDESEKLLLSKNPQGINHINKKGLSYLHIACTGNDLSLVEALLANGTSIDDRTHFSTWDTGYSPLHFAVRTEQVEVVEFLLRRGADPNCVNDKNIAPLHLACRHRDEQYRQLKFEDDQFDDELDWQTSRAGHTRIIELLIEHGASVNAKSSHQRSTPILENCSIPPILYSLCHSQDLRKKKIAESLLKEVFTRQVKVMDILLRHGADINARGCERDKPILSCLMENLHRCPLNLDLIKTALVKGADVNVLNIFGVPPLQEAISESMRISTLGISLINLFLEFGADINGRESKLDTPLHCATYCYYRGSSSLQKNIIKKLLSRPNIDVNARNRFGRIALHNALYFDIDHSIIKKLLDAGSDINLGDEGGDLPFDLFLLRSENRHNALNDEYVREIFSAMALHIKKMMKLDFFVNDKVKTHLDKISQYLPRDDLVSMNTRIDEEVTKLKSQMIDQDTSLYHILFADANFMARHTQNKILTSVIASIRLHQNYSVFGDIIERQYNRGCIRRTLLDAAKVALSDLSDEDLRNLVKSSAKPTSTTENCKRPPENSSSPGESQAKIPRSDG